MGTIDILNFLSWIRGLSVQSGVMSAELSLRVSPSAVRQLREHRFAHALNEEAEARERAQITNPNIHGYLCARLPWSYISRVKNQ